MTDASRFHTNAVMCTRRGTLVVLALVSFCAFSMCVEGSAAEPVLEVGEGDSIVFIGNTFAERMSLFGYFETALHSRFPDHQLRVRNMGWPADEVALMPRPAAFGEMHRYLGEQKADVIFAFFGMNESFAGVEGVEGFERDLDTLIGDLRAHQYNGQSAPRIVLVSPIAHENLGGDLPDGVAHNADLALYTAAMGKSAQQLGIRFVDLFTPTRALLGTAPENKLTINGIHLTVYGDWAVSQMLARSLGLVDAIDPSGPGDEAVTDRLRRTIYDKNYSFLFYWRGPNMEYVHGERNYIPGAEGMMEELAQLNGIIDQLDAKIWEIPKPKPETVWASVPSGEPMWVKTPSYEDVAIPPLGDVKPMEGHRVEEEGEGTMLTPQEALDAMEIADGYAVNLFASEVDFPIANPLALNFDAEGRLWIANSPTWPHPLPGVPPTDSILILEDTDHDGVADSHTVFMDGLNMVHGFALGDGGAYISQTPNIIFAADMDGDNRADEFETVLHGFGGEDVEHSINNYKWGPDGALYFMQGIFFHSQIESPYGPSRVYGGGVFRYKPRTEKFDMFLSYEFWNPWGQVFDRWGQSIILDASSHDYYNMDVLSSNYVYPKVKENKSENLSFAMRDMSPGAGIDIVRSRQFPEEAQGRFLANEITRAYQGMHWYDIEEDGTGYELSQVVPDFLSSTDPYFRPIAMTFGPDGALYFIDFYSTLFENMMHPKRAEGRDHIRGRVWRIVYEDRPLLEAPKIVGASVPELLDLLDAYESTTRDLARRALHERDADEVVPHLERWIAGLDGADEEIELHLLDALWVYHGLNVLEEHLLKQLLRAKDAHVRAAAARVLRFEQNEIEGSIDLLSTLIEDGHPRVRLQAVLASGFSASGRGAEVALKATMNPMDAGLQHALDDTMDYFDRAPSP